MKTETDAKLLTIYIDSADQYHGRPLYAAIVQLCHEHGIAGATVLRAMEGYGATGHLHTARLLELGEHLAVQVEIIDTSEKINTLLPLLDTMIGKGLVTLADVHILRYAKTP